MFALTLLLLRAITMAFRGHHDVVLENLALRHQLRTLQRRVKRPHLHNRDRMFWVLLATAWRQWQSALVLVHPETVVRWHRTWLRRRWAQRSGRNRAGRPPLDPAIVRLLTDMAGAKVRGYFFIVRACVPRLAQRATITLLSGASALRPPRQGMAVLSAANAAVISFGHALALELAPVRVNVITPGAVDTAVWTPDERTNMRRWAESELPARYFAQPDSIAQAILFVMTNPNMTGQNLIIDGGLTAQS